MTTTEDIPVADGPMNVQRLRSMLAMADRERFDKGWVQATQDILLFLEVDRLDIARPRIEELWAWTRGWWVSAHLARDAQWKADVDETHDMIAAGTGRSIGADELRRVLDV